MNYESFMACRDESIMAFSTDNGLVASVESGQFGIADYQSLLTHLHYQTLKAPVSFALAGANCCRRERWRQVADYLIHHANDENGHYRWIEQDAEHVGGLRYNGDTDPPPSATSTYVAFNFFIADEFPIGRLAIASYLEGVAARIGPTYIPSLIKSVGLSEECFKFFTTHTTTDACHIEELDEILGGLNMSSSDWNWMIFSVSTASRLYKCIYNEVAHGTANARSSH